MDVSGVILAAGESKRMGKPKALLEIGERKVVRILSDEYLKGGVSELVIVVNPVIAGEVERELAAYKSHNVKLVVNNDYRKGMFTSVKAGVAQARYSTIILGLVDNPLVRSSTIAVLINSFGDSDVLIPRHAGKKGHPVMFSEKVRSRIVCAEDSTTLRDLLEEFDKSTRFVEIEDEGVLIDMDRREDYESILQRWKEL